MGFQYPPLAACRDTIFQNTTWSIESQCPSLGQSMFSMAKKTSELAQLCAEKIFLGVDLYSSYLFTDCFCNSEYDVTKIVDHYGVLPTFSNPKSPVEKLILAIFRGDAKEAKKCLRQKNFSLTQKLDANFIIHLSLMLSEYEILKLFLDTDFAMNHRLWLDYKSNAETRENILHNAEQDRSKRYEDQIVSSCLKIAYKSKHKAALWVALLTGDTQRVKELALSGRINLNESINNKGETPLEIAIGCGDLKMVQALKELQIDFSAPSKRDEKEPLNMALDLNQLEIARFLVENGASLKNINNYKFDSSIGFEEAKYILELGGSLNRAHFVNLISGSNVGSEEFLTLLDVHLAKHKPSSGFYFSLFSRALNTEKFDLARAITSRAVAIDPSFIPKNSLVNLSYMKADLKTFQFMLSTEGGSVNERDQFSRFPLLHHACSYSFSSNLSANVLDYEEKLGLIKACPDLNLNQVDQGGKTALFYAIEAGKEDLVDFLLEQGADPDILDRSEKRAEDYDSTENQVFRKKILLKKEQLEQAKMLKKYASWAAVSSVIVAALAAAALKVKSKKSEEEEVEVLSEPVKLASLKPVNDEPAQEGLDLNLLESFPSLI